MHTPVPPQPALAVSQDDVEGHSGASALTALYDRTVDSIKGYAKMVEKAEPSFRHTAERFHTLHIRHASVLARMLAKAGITVDPDGTLMGTVNQTVVTVRAFFDDIDENVMDQVRSGEGWVLKAFQAAITDETDADQAAELREMCAELETLLANTDDLG